MGKYNGYRLLNIKI